MPLEAVCWETYGRLSNVDDPLGSTFSYLYSVLPLDPLLEASSLKAPAGAGFSGQRRFFKPSWSSCRLPFSAKPTHQPFSDPGQCIYENPPAIHSTTQPRKGSTEAAQWPRCFEKLFPAPSVCSYSTRSSRCKHAYPPSTTASHTSCSRPFPTSGRPNTTKPHPSAGCTTSPCASARSPARRSAAP